MIASLSAVVDKNPNHLAEYCTGWAKIGKPLLVLQQIMLICVSVELLGKLSSKDVVSHKYNLLKLLLIIYIN